MNPQAPVPVSPARPRPALVVVAAAGGAGAQPAVDARLLQALPAAGRVLELHSGAASLAAAYRLLHPDCDWTALNLGALSGPAPTLPDGPFDLIVVADLLPWLADPLALLRDLAQRVAAEGRLLISVDNHARRELLEQWLDADLGADPRRSPAAGQPRLCSPATVYKLLMDAGWMPDLRDHEAEPAAGEPLRAALGALAAALGRQAGGGPERVQGMRRLIIEARPLFARAAAEPGQARFDVLVPTNDERQLRLNVEASPGLAEVGARIVSYRGAANPAEAFELGSAELDADWVLLCHQDVYFPAGFGSQLNAVLRAIPAAERRRALIGFVGLGAGAQGQGRAPAGFVIDRLQRADHPASAAAVSIDELAIVLARDSVHRIDPALGWHLWATDLCLVALCEHGVLPRIVRLPLFHNSRTGWTLPPAYRSSAAVLARKWAGYGEIHTLCGVIDASAEPGRVRAAADGVTA